ncbi:MAG: hypothetical protein U0903_02285 [Planctomycetales bacterium]
MMDAPEIRAMFVRFPVVSMIVAAWTLSLPAADRVVLIQPVWDDMPPHYVTICGGRSPHYQQLVLKAGRHSPSDEWIMHQVRPDTYLFESTDPFYRNRFINVYNKTVRSDPLRDAHQACLYPRQPLHDEWKISVPLPGIVALQATNTEFENSFLTRVTTSNPAFNAVAIRQLLPERVPDTYFRIIDVTPTRPMIVNAK